MCIMLTFFRDALSNRKISILYLSSSMAASIGFKTLVHEGSPRLHGKGKRKTDIALYVIPVCQYANDACIYVFLTTY